MKSYTFIADFSLDLFTKSADPPLKKNNHKQSTVIILFIIINPHEIVTRDNSCVAIDIINSTSTYLNFGCHGWSNGSL